MHRSALLAIRSTAHSAQLQSHVQPARLFSFSSARWASRPDPQTSGPRESDNQGEQTPGASTDEVAHSHGAFNAEADPHTSSSQIEQDSNADMGTSYPSASNPKSTFSDARDAELNHPKDSEKGKGPKSASGGPALSKAKH